MSEFSNYDCSCLDEIEKDIIHYLDNKPEISQILEKEKLDVEDVVCFIKTMNKEIWEINQYYGMKRELAIVRRSYMEEAYLDEANFPYNIHRREWFNTPCPSYEEEVYIEEEVIRGPYGNDDYYVEGNEYLDITSCDINPGIENIVLDCMESYMYNKLSSGIIHKYLHYYIDTNQELKDLLSKIENKITHIVDTLVCSRNWKGSWYYFYRIFGFPIYFSEKYEIYDIDLTDSEKELYEQLNKTKHNVDVSKCKKEYYHNFKGMIEGHPLAFNGIFQEGLQELQELECYN